MGFKGIADHKGRIIFVMYPACLDINPEQIRPVEALKPYNKIKEAYQAPTYPKDDSGAAFLQTDHLLQGYAIRSLIGC